jgi:hypothetical protein
MFPENASDSASAGMSFAAFALAGRLRKNSLGAVQIAVLVHRLGQTHLCLAQIGRVLDVLGQHLHPELKKLRHRGRWIARAPIAEKHRDFSRYRHVDETLPGSIDNSEAFRLRSDQIALQNCRGKMRISPPLFPIELAVPAKTFGSGTGKQSRSVGLRAGSGESDRSLSGGSVLPLTVN